MFAQAVHIFKKDARRLRWPAAISLALLAIATWFSCVSVDSGQLQTPWGAMPAGLVFLSWWYLAVLSIHGEPLIGDREFWLTRPYLRTSLVLSKCLFLLAFIHLPVLIADITILLLYDYAPLDFVISLISHQLGIAFMVLPFVALAYVTSTLIQVIRFALGWTLLFYVGLSLWVQYRAPELMIPGAFAWVKSLVSDWIVYSLVVAMVVLQVVFRRAAMSRTLPVFALLPVGYVSTLMPVDTRFHLDRMLHMPTPDEERIQIIDTAEEIDPKQWEDRRDSDRQVTIRKLFDVRNVPPRHRLVAEHVLIDFSIKGYRSYIRRCDFRTLPGKGLLTFTDDIPDYKDHLDKPAKIRATLYLQVIEEREVKRLSMAATSIDDGSKIPCSALPLFAVPAYASMECKTPFGEYSLSYRPKANGTARDMVFSRESRGLLPSWTSLNPMKRLNEEPSGGWVVDSSSLVLLQQGRRADIKRVIDIEVPRLADLLH